MKYDSYTIYEKQCSYFRIWKWKKTMSTQWNLSSSKFKTIKLKDYGTLEAKLSWQEPQLPHLKNSSMNITNWHTSRIRFHICPDKEKYYFWELSDIFKCELCMKTFTANEYMAHTLFIEKDWKDPLQTTTCFTGDYNESTLFYSTNPFNLSWETKNSGCGLFRIPSHKSVSLQRVLPEMRCPT